MSFTFLQNIKVHRYLPTCIFAFLFVANSFAQTPVVMSGYTATAYVENFSDIANWSFSPLTSATTPAASVGTFSAGIGAAAWRGLFANTTSNTAMPRQIPDPTKIIQPTSTAVAANNFGMKFQVITSSGLQKNETANPTFPAGKLGIVATGTTDSTTSAIADFYLDFSGVAPGVLGFTAEKVTNTVATIPRVASLLAYGSIDGITWVAIPLGTNVWIDNSATVQSYTISGVALPSIFNNSATARIRFYALNGGSPGSPSGSGGNRPRMAIDDVSVTALSGCATPITFSSVSPTSPSVICATNAISLSAAATGTTGINYLWSASTLPAVSGLSTFNTSSVNVSPTATTIYTVTASAGSCVSSTSFSVTVSALPVLTVSPSSATVCAGGTQSFTATSATAVSFNWLPITNLNTATGATVVSTPSTNITYTVSAIDAVGCVKTATASITYIASVNVTVASTNLTLNCIGDATTLTASGANSYVWANASGLSGTSTAVVSASPLVTTTYTVTGTAGACSGTTIVTVIANANPIPTISVVATSPVVCAAGSTAITASGANTYSWANAATLSAATGATVTASPTSAITYTVTGTSLAGCSATTTIGLTIASLPSVTASAAPAAVCPTGSTTLTASGASSYVWSNGDLTPTSLVTLASATTTFTVTGTNAVGCTKSTTILVSVLANGAKATYNFSTSIPFLGIYDVLLQCNTNIYASGIGFGNQNGTPTSQINATSASTIGSGGANAGVACIGGGASLNPATSSYFEFTFAPECGKALVLNGITLNSRSTSTGPQLLSILTSADNFTTAVGSATSLFNSSWNPISFSFPSVSLTTSDTFKIRIYGSNASGSGGASTINWRIDDININIGTTSITPNYPTITFTPSAPSVCQSTPVQITASGATSYNWGTPVGLSNIVGGSVFAAPTATTIYTVAVANGVCATSATISVFVPTASAPVSVTVCSNMLPYIWKGMPYLATGTYTNVSIVGGCLDTATLHLTVCQVSYNTDALVVCTLPYTWSLYSHTFTAYGSDTVLTGTNSCGCPTYTILTAISGQPTVINTTVDLCANYAFPYLSGPNPPYVAFGTYTTSVIGIGGCAVITNFNLQPKPLATNTITVVAPVPYVYLSTYTITIHSNVFPAPPANVYTFTAANGCDSIVTLIVNAPAVSVWPGFTGGIYLWGPSTGAISAVTTFTGCPNCVMNDTLRVLGLIPASEPYTALGYIPVGTGGGETIGANVLNVSGQNAIVDWVCIRIRKIDVQTNTYTTQKTVCALLQADGDIVSATDGISPVRFPGLPNGNYNVQVNHRNHLGVMTANEIAFSNTTIANVDFTSVATPLFSLPAPNQNASPLSGPARIAGGKRYLYAGNCDYTNAAYSLSARYLKRKLISYNNIAAFSDRLELLNNTGGTATTTNAYTLGDLNFNGRATYNGANSDRGIMQQCVLMSTAIYINEQTPD